MNRAFSIVALVVVFAAAGLSQTPCTRYAVPDFSICQPAGWTVDGDGEGYKTFSGTSAGGLKANVNFSEDSNQMKLSDYVDATNKYTVEHFTDNGFTSLSLVSRTSVVTDTNETGIKSVLLEEMKGLKLRSFQYIFDAGKNKLLVTFTSFDSASAANEKLFDETIKTLKLVH